MKCVLPCCVRERGPDEKSLSISQRPRFVIWLALVWRQASTSALPSALLGFVAADHHTPRGVWSARVLLRLLRRGANLFREPAHETAAGPPKRKPALRWPLLSRGWIRAGATAARAVLSASRLCRTVARGARSSRAAFGDEDVPSTGEAGA